MYKFFVKWCMGSYFFFEKQQEITCIYINKEGLKQSTSGTPSTVVEKVQIVLY
jgi:hypothetical protein